MRVKLALMAAWALVLSTAGAAPLSVRSVDQIDSSTIDPQTGGFAAPSFANETVQAIAADGDGSWIVVGQTTGSLPGRTNAGLGDVFVRKYDANGVAVWTVQFGTAGDERGLAIAVVDTGYDRGLYVAGSTTGVLVPHDEWPAPPPPGPRAAYDGFVRKYSLDVDAATGAPSVLWTDQFGSALFDQVNAIAVHRTGVYVAGGTNGTLPGQTGVGPDAFVRKYDFDGQTSDACPTTNPAPVWTCQFGTSATDGANGIALHDAGVFVVGNTAGPLQTGAWAGLTDAFLRRYDFDGHEVWTRQMGTAGNDAATAVAAGATSVAIVGTVRGRLPGQPPLSGSSDAFVRTYDLDGNTDALWTRQFGSTQDDQANAVAVDANGVYLAGFTSGTLPGQAANPRPGVNDAFVSRYDAAGNEVWTRQLGTNQADSAFTLAVSAGTVLVAGSAAGPLVAGDATLGSSDAFLRTYSEDGVTGWTRQFGSFGPVDDLGLAVAQVGASVYAGGAVGGTLPGQAANLTPGVADAFLRKFHLDGRSGHPPTVEWTRQFGTAQPDQVNAIAANDGGVYVAGHTAGTLGQSSAGGQDAFVRRYDADGNEVWTRQFGTAQPDQAVAIAVDDTAVYVAGLTAGSLAGSSGGQDAFVRKYDLDGNDVWTRQFGTAQTDRASGIALSGDAVLVVGVVAGALPGQAWLGNNDGFLRRYDRDGNELWTRQLGTSNADAASGVATGRRGVYVVGTVQGQLPGQPALGGSSDAFVGKYDLEGNSIWTRVIQSAAIDGGAAVSVDEAAALVYVAGNANFPLAGFDDTHILDAFVSAVSFDGDPQGSRQYPGTTNMDQAAAICASSLGVITVGSTQSRLDDPSAPPRGLDAFVEILVSGR